MLLFCLVLASFYEYAIAFFHELMDEHDWLHLSAKRRRIIVDWEFDMNGTAHFDYIYLPRD